MPQNLLLKSLPAELSEQIRSHLEPTNQQLSELLYMPRQKIEYVYFPETSVISTVAVLQNGNGVEAGIIGKEGVLGASTIFAENIAHAEATVQHGGMGKCMKVSVFKELFDDNKLFRDRVLYYVYSYIAQISQNAACLSFHPIEQRLARWFLMFSDRRGSAELVLTQEFIAQMLGVHRPSVSINAKKLQDRGYIDYSRGVIKILDRPNLVKFACECYREINESLKGYT